MDQAAHLEAPPKPPDKVPCVDDPCSMLEVAVNDHRVAALEVLEPAPEAVHATPEQQRWCQRLGMNSKAADDWLLWHVDLRTALLSFFLSQLVSIACMASLQLGVHITRYAYTVPNLVAIAYHATWTVASWRYGPQLFKSKLFRISVLPGVACTVAPLIVSFLGPLSYVPFRSSLTHVLVTACFVVSRSCVNDCGLIAREQPPEPRHSLADVAVRAAVKAARICDSLTDMSFIRVLIVEV
jgi:hypothetical protein